MKDCVFCKIIKGQLPAKKIFEDENFLAFNDISPKANTHILVIPKKHISKISDCQDSDQNLIGGLILTAKKIAAKKNIKGYKLLFNVDKEGGQVVFHIHLHLLAGKKINLEQC